MDEGIHRTASNTSDLVNRGHLALLYTASNIDGGTALRSSRP